MPNPVAELLFSEADATPMSTDESTVKSWADAAAIVAEQPKAWLSTSRPDGRPHVAPVVVLWLDGAVWIAARPGSRKARNLEAGGRAVVAVSDETMDVVIEGAVTRAVDQADLRRVADALVAAFEWKFSIRDGSAFDDSLPGSPEYGFYRVAPVRAFGYGPDGLTATRWRF